MFILIFYRKIGGTIFPRVQDTWNKLLFIIKLSVAKLNVVEYVAMRARWILPIGRRRNRRIWRTKDLSFPLEPA